MIDLGWAASLLPLIGAGFGVGFLVGLTGVGGGALMTPLLIVLFGVNPATAVGTDLIYAAATKSGGSLVHGFAHSIDWRVVRLLATGSLPATAATLAALSRFNLDGDATRSLITLVLSVALLLTAFVLVFGESLVALYRRRVSPLEDERTAASTVLVGAVLGCLVSISSVGAGALGVVALVLLYPRMPMAKIVGSDITHAVPLTLAAGAGHWAMGSVDWPVVGALLVGSLPGIVLGSTMAIRIPERALKLVLATVLLVVAGRLSFEHATAASSVFTAFTGRAMP
jgi:uncharacterized membrane protein YfcA